MRYSQWHPDTCSDLYISRCSFVVSDKSSNTAFKITLKRIWGKFIHQHSAMGKGMLKPVHLHSLRVIWSRDADFKASWCSKTGWRGWSAISRPSSEIGCSTTLASCSLLELKSPLTWVSPTYTLPPLPHMGHCLCLECPRSCWPWGHSLFDTVPSFVFLLCRGYLT